MKTIGLHLRSSRCLGEVAEEMTHRLWKALSREEALGDLDPHRFPAFSKALQRVLWSHVDLCARCDTPSHCDCWARTGGGSPSSQECSPPCQNHERQLWEESGDLLKKLLGEIRQETYSFLVHLLEKKTLALTTKRIVDDATDRAIKPFLLKNIASSCCNRCSLLVQHVIVNN